MISCKCGCGNLATKQWKRGHHPQSVETRAKIRVSKLGQLHSEETKAKIKNSMMGHMISAETSEKISRSRKGQMLNFDHRHKLVDAHRGFTGLFHSDEAKQKMSEIRLRHLANHRGPWKDTKPELELASRLQSASLVYETQKRIGNILVDFYLPQQNLVIEVDGCWWHGCLDCYPSSQYLDKFTERCRKLEFLGYSSIRIWEHELVS